ncbi:ABC-type Fe3+-hydroxamate transport system substrate-binding protein [Pantoea cypripedii]|nr:ABC-type Fe3+-hydroxamate transport system substrate-binding protein [Pantoea cypripedii]
MKKWMLALGLLTVACGASAKVITDVAGRQVEVAQESKRIILGEGRQMYLLAAFDTQAPFQRVVGWRDDFHKADYDGYMAYEKRYPQIKQLPTFGGAKDGTFNVEQALTLKPDLVLMNLESKRRLTKVN